MEDSKAVAVLVWEETTRANRVAVQGNDWIRALVQTQDIDDETQKQGNSQHCGGGDDLRLIPNNRNLVS
jgi:hypothetical protein